MVAALELWSSVKTPRPPLKWAGGKRWLVPHLMRLWMPQRERAILRASRAVQRAYQGGRGRERGSGGALLLFEPHRLQRALPLQPQGRVQRPVRALQANQLHDRLQRLSRRVRRLGTQYGRLRKPRD